MKTFNIIGAKQCMTHVFLGDKGHLVPRSNHIRCDNGFEAVWCVMCGIDHIGLPSVIDALVFGSGSFVEPVRHESRLDYRFTFRYGNDEKAFVTYDSVEQFDIEPQLIGRVYNAGEFNGIPKKLDAVARALTAIGFRVTGPADRTEDLEEFHRHHLRTIIMVRGKRLFPDDPDKQAVDGVRVELSYIVGL
jgi:hypothetical protein